MNEIYNGSSDGFNYLVDGYMDYSREVIARRAIPDLRDGLKPVQRRIIYSAKINDKRQLQKCAVVVADAMKLHPHGDSSVYGAFCLMTDTNGSWNMPLFKGMGNLGKVYSSDPPAAYRYPKAMLHPNAEEYFKEKDIFKLVQSEEGDGVEPEVLLPSYPTVLVNGTAGIAVSVGTRIPSFNFMDVIDLTKKYITDGKLDPVKDIIYPDFPTGGVIVKTDSEVAKIMATGTGKVKIRANVEIQGSDIVVNEVPFGKTFEGIVKQVESAEMREIKSVINMTGNNTDGRVIITCRSKKVVDFVLLELYRRGILQTTFASNILVINDGKPYILGVHGIIADWVAFRREVILKKFEHELEGITSELTTLSYFIKLVGNAEWKNTYVEKATKQSKKDADAYLHEIFPDIPVDVCDWINGRAISAFNNGGRYVNRYNDLCEYRDYCNDMHANPDKYIVKELDDLKKSKKGMCERKTYISNVDYRFSKVVDSDEIEDDSPCVYTLTKEGFFFKTRDSLTAVGALSKEKVLCEFEGCANSILVGFDNFGRVLRMNGSDIAYSAIGSEGIYLPKLFDASFEESYKVLYMCVCDGSKKMLVYRDGYVGFFDTSEWVGKKVVKVISKGVPLAVGDKLLEIYEEDEIPECLILADDTGKEIKLGIIAVENISERSRTSRAKIFPGTTINTKYIRGMSYSGMYQYIKNPQDFAGKLAYIKDDTFMGEMEEMLDGYYLELCPDLEV